jgi:hypothetical protein
VSDSLRDRLAKALQECEYWQDAGRRFQSTVDDSEIDDARPFVFAFGYSLIESRSEERRQASGGPFGAASRMNGWQFPPPLDTIDEPTLESWSEYADTSDHPVALSRLHDLLWERRHGKAHLHASAAIDAYLELAEGPWRSMYRTFAALRALELAQAINDEDRTSKAIDTCIRLIERDLAEAERTPGIALRLLETLVALSKDRRPETTPALVEAAGERYGDDPWIAQSVDDLRAALVKPEDRQEIARQQVERWRAEADRAAGILRYAHRQHALQLALDNGLSDLADAIRRDIQSMTVEELDLKAVSAEVEIEAGKVDEIIEAIVGDDGWPEALTRFGLQGPPTGIVENNEAAVDEARAAFPLQALIPQQVIGAHRSLVFSAADEGERRRLDFVRQEGFGLALFSPLAARVLDRIAERYGTPDEDDLSVYLAEGPVEPDLAAQLAAGLSYYWRGEFDAAGHMLAPRIEATIRHLCVAVGIPVIKQPIAGKPGGVYSLGLLLDELRGRLDESWRRYLAHLLSDPLGLNLRNEIGHGLIGVVDQSRCALLVHAVCHLRLLAPSEDDAERAEHDDHNA